MSSGMSSTLITLPMSSRIAVPTRPSSICVGTAMSSPDVDQRPPPSVQGIGTATSALPSAAEANIPSNVCVASVKRENSSRPARDGGADGWDDGTDDAATSVSAGSVAVDAPDPIGDADPVGDPDPVQPAPTMATRSSVQTVLSASWARKVRLLHGSGDAYLSIQLPQAL